MKKTVLACALGVLVASATFSPALADPWDHRHHRFERDYHHDWYPWHHVRHAHDPFFWGPMDRWHAGRWFFGFHQGYSGWWWVVGDAWYLYGARVAATPNIYTQPMVVVSEGQAPLVYQTVTTPSPQTIVTTTPAPATTIVTTTSSAAPGPAPATSGTIVKFKDSAPATIEATPASSTFIDKNGRTCREYQTSITVEGKRQPAKGTACLEADGSWRVVK